jgi:hypothetical protein
VPRLLMLKNMCCLKCQIRNEKFTIEYFFFSQHVYHVNPSCAMLDALNSRVRESGATCFLNSDDVKILAESIISNDFGACERACSLIQFMCINGTKELYFQLNSLFEPQIKALHILSSTTSNFSTKQVQQFVKIYAQTLAIMVYPVNAKLGIDIRDFPFHLFFDTCMETMKQCSNLLSKNVKEIDLEAKSTIDNKLVESSMYEICVLSINLFRFLKSVSDSIDFDPTIDEDDDISDEDDVAHDNIDAITCENVSSTLLCQLFSQNLLYLSELLQAGLSKTLVTMILELIDVWIASLGFTSPLLDRKSILRYFSNFEEIEVAFEKLKTALVYTLSSSLNQSGNILVMKLISRLLYLFGAKGLLFPLSVSQFSRLSSPQKKFPGLLLKLLSSCLKVSLDQAIEEILVPYNSVFLQALFPVNGQDVQVSRKVDLTILIPLQVHVWRSLFDFYSAEIESGSHYDHVDSLISIAKQHKDILETFLLSYSSIQDDDVVTESKIEMSLSSTQLASIQACRSARTLIQHLTSNNLNDFILSLRSCFEFIPENLNCHSITSIIKYLFLESISKPVLLSYFDLLDDFRGESNDSNNQFRQNVSLQVDVSSLIISLLKHGNENSTFVSLIIDDAEVVKRRGYSRLDSNKLNVLCKHFTSSSLDLVNLSVYGIFMPDELAFQTLFVKSVDFLVSTKLGVMKKDYPNHVLRVIKVLDEIFNASLESLEPLMLEIHKYEHTGLAESRIGPQVIDISYNLRALLELRSHLGKEWVLKKHDVSKCESFLQKIDELI